jgi:hypothetical protein
MPSVQKGGGSPARTSKYDVDFVRAQVDLARMRNWGIAMSTLATGAAWGLGILSFGVAVWLSKGVVHELAGRRTVIEADIGLKLGLAVSLLINFAALIHAQVRKRTIVRLRKRLTKMERGLTDLEIDVDADLEIDAG